MFSGNDDDNNNNNVSASRAAAAHYTMTTDNGTQFQITAAGCVRSRIFVSDRLQFGT